MLSILMKRQAQLKPKQVNAEAQQPEVSVIARPAFLGKPWEETQAMLKQELKYVRTLSGSKEKDPFKEELIKKYRPLVEELLETHKGNYGNLDVMWWWFLWHVDLGKLEDIYEDFRAAISAGLECPNTWKMNGQTAFLGYVQKYSQKAYEAKKPFNREYLVNAVKDLRAGELATNPPLKVKMFRLVGDWHFEEGEKKEAHDLFEQVMKLDPSKGGRKTKLKDLREELGYDSPN
ncbi:phage terminase small subunit [Vibrio coralliilyticus]|uniref:phage terminase small subunit n=1 Tax=Vibrio coralliilyticus TaxID=190893 RepID=UPI0002ED17BA|nr:phage terminase small subunit [Vibrio coralliilyticus]